MTCAFFNHREQSGDCIRRSCSNLVRRVTPLQIYMLALETYRMASAPIWLASSRYPTSRVGALLQHVTIQYKQRHASLCSDTYPTGLEDYKAVLCY